MQATSVFQRLVAQLSSRLRLKDKLTCTTDELEVHRINLAIAELTDEIKILSDTMGLDRGQALSATDMDQIMDLARNHLNETISAQLHGTVDDDSITNFPKVLTYANTKKTKGTVSIPISTSRRGRDKGAPVSVKDTPFDVEMNRLRLKREEEKRKKLSEKAKKYKKAKNLQVAKQVEILNETLDKEPSHEERLFADFVYYCEHIITITYRPGMNLEHPLGGFGPFKLNSAQLKVAALIIHLLFVDKVPVRIILLKSRQLGCTTLLLALWSWLMLTQPHFHVMFLIDKDQHGKTKRDEMVRWLNEAAKKCEMFPGIAKRDEKFIVLTNGSKLFFESAESPNPGTSEMIHALHESEKPKWPRGRAQQVEESVTPGLPAAPMTLHIDESTAMGIDEFYYRWERAVREEGTKGVTRLVPIFLPWYLSPEYAHPVPAHFMFLDEDVELCDEILSENGDEVTLTESQYAVLHSLTKEQVYWRRLKIKDTFKGNRASFDQEYPTTPEHAWKATQQSFFPRKSLDAAFRALRTPIRVGRFVDVDGYNDHNNPLLHYRLRPMWQDYGGGEIEIFEDPVPGEEYFAGVDVAEGKSTTSAQGDLVGDYTVIPVLNSDGRLVARYRSRVRPEEAWLPLLLLGVYYNYAWINGERNGPGLVLLSYFLRCGYPRMLVQLRPESRPVVDRTWTTVNGTNREELLARIRASVAGDPSRVVDQVLWNELKTFVRRMQGGKVKAEAQAGAHDDYVMGYAHAEHARFWRLGFDGKVTPTMLISEVPPEDSPETFGQYKLGVNVFLEDVDF